MAILINRNDSPKFYLYIKDIYGAALGVDPTDFVDLSYSVYTVVGTTRTAVTGFVDVAIPRAHFYTEPQQYPETIKNVTSSDKNIGYNLKLFPYKTATADNVSVWQSPFSEVNTKYEIRVNISYYMGDDALSGTALLTRTIPIEVQTRS